MDEIKIAKRKEANRIIDALGGTSLAAEIFDVTTGGISQWRQQGIPRGRLQYIKLLRPDIFDLSPQPVNQQNRKEIRRAADKPERRHRELDK